MLHPLAQPLLDLEAFGRLDILEVDGAEGRLQRGDDVHEVGRIALVDLDVEDVDAGEGLEQDRLALHHRLGGKRTDRSQPQDGGAVGDDPDQIAPGGDAGGLAGIGDDHLAGGGDPGGIGQRQIALIGQRLGRDDGELSGGR